MFNSFNFLNEIKFENRNYGLFFSFSNWQYFYSPGLSNDLAKIFMGIHQITYVSFIDDKNLVFGLYIYIYIKL